MEACQLCGRAVYHTPAGRMCSEHGGEPPIEERPDDETLEVAQTMQHLVQLREHVLRGGTLDRANALWLLERASGGMWGRWAASLMQDVKNYRRCLRVLVLALMDRSGEHWTHASWSPIAVLLEQYKHHDDVPLPGPVGKLSGFRLIEQGERRE